MKKTSWWKGVKCAYLVAKGIVPFATGSDDWWLNRKPASFNNIVRFKPSYGSN